MERRNFILHYVKYANIYANVLYECLGKPPLPTCWLPSTFLYSARSSTFKSLYSCRCYFNEAFI